LVFGSEENKDILADFLQSMLDLDADEYEDIEIVDPHMRKTKIDGKLSVLDLKIKTKTQKFINIEIQIANSAQIRERIVFYTSRLIGDQIKSGEDYKIIKKSISIIISDFIILDHGHYYDRFRFHSKLTNTEFSDVMEINTLELPKLPKNPDKTNRWYWAKFVQTEDKEVLKMLAKTNPVMNKAVDVIERLSMSDEIRAEYEAREKAIRDYNMFMNDKLEEGLKIGLQKGEKLGL
jgi:predicted transposase/invertase (TIGR01784 family)